MQAMQWVGHLTAEEAGASNAAGWGEHLRAHPSEKRVQVMRRGEHLRAQPPKKWVQAMRRGEHLRA